MRYFRHTIAEYACVKHCGYHRSVIGANWSLFHLIAAAVAALALWLYSLCSQFPWYYAVSIMAGECLLIYCAGFLSSLVVGPFRAVLRCKHCGAPMMLCGRHFDPAGSPRPHWTDIVIFALFLCLNVAVWICFVRADL